MRRVQKKFLAGWASMVSFSESNIIKVFKDVMMIKKKAKLSKVDSKPKAKVKSIVKSIVKSKVESKSKMVSKIKVDSAKVDSVKVNSKAESSKADKLDKTDKSDKAESKLTKKLVIVESPTKAKTIRKYLGKGFIVESCMGHVRDLPQSAKDIPEKYKKEKWAQLGVNVDQEFEPIYCVPRNKEKVVKGLKDKLKDATELYLATDEDREGESISWHLVEVLKPKIPLRRMVFNEITSEAIKKALTETRQIDTNLVKAQEARRVLDRLVGYTISPLLWKKIAFGLSAGRVQSVAVRLLVEKEYERLSFKRAEYWGVLAKLKDSAKNSDKNSDKKPEQISDVEFDSKLLLLKGEKIAIGKDFDPQTGKASKDVLCLDEKAAQAVVKQVSKSPFKVVEVEEKPVTRRPSPPFITSTLQQEANRKFGLSSRDTMQTAQKLYEQGFITYMRTDSTFLSNEALTAARDCIGSKYGKDYLPSQPRVYEAKQGAQEAHEAIRPAGNQFVDPDNTGLVGMQLKLYDLIWKRTVASQMLEAKQKQLSVKLDSAGAIFAASGMTIEFAGFLRAYVEGSDDPEAELSEREVRLPKLAVGDEVKLVTCETTSHETKPPARYSEATLIQKLEQEGVGRPSTYAAIMGTILDRGYAKRLSNALAPTFTAMVVSKLLKTYLPEYVDLGFTSQMEKSLDTIAEGKLDTSKYLSSVYFGKKGLKETVEVQGKKIDPDEARGVKLGGGLEKYEFRVGRFGAYVSRKEGKGEVSATLPDSESPADMTAEKAELLIEQKLKGVDSIGQDPVSKKPVYVLNGRFGPYVQLGESDSDKVKRMAIPQGHDPATVDLNKALFLLSMPRPLGIFEDKQAEIKLGVGRFGPYVVCDGEYRSIPKTDDVFAMTLDRAVELMRQPKKGRGRSSILKELGQHSSKKDAVVVMSGPYGPYVKCGKVNASLPEGTKVEDVTLKMAEGFLEQRLQSLPSR